MHDMIDCTTMKQEKQAVLPEDYKPQPLDILSGRTRESFNHEGNKEFRTTIAMMLPQYCSLATRGKRRVLIASILSDIHMNGGRFLERKNNSWVTLTRELAHKKVAHALRDAALRQRQSMVSTSKIESGVVAPAKTEKAPQMARPQKRTKPEPAIEDFKLIDFELHDYFDDSQDHNNIQLLPKEYASSDWTRYKEILLFGESLTKESDPNDDKYLCEVLQDWKETK